MEGYVSDGCRAYAEYGKLPGAGRAVWARHDPGGVMETKLRSRRWPWLRLLLVAGLACGSLGGMALTANSPAHADDRTILRTITAQSPACGVGTGLAFDGKQLLVDCWSQNQIWGVSPADGSLLNTYSISGATDLRAMAWDRGRGKLWACNSDADIYLVDLSKLSATFAFGSQGCTDGLAYDGTDDTIWSSADAASTVQHYKIDGTLLASKDVSGLLGGCGNSGIAVGGSRLLLSNNGCSQIYIAPKTLDSSSLFGTYSARLEDLECDDVTFAANGKAAIWSKDAYDNVLNAFELNPGTCGYGGFAPSPLYVTPTNQTRVAGALLPEVKFYVNDPITGAPVANAKIVVSVVSGPNSGV